MMKECFCCCLISMMIGAIVGGTLVVSNRSIEKTFKKGKDMVTEKIEDIADKIQESKSKKSNKAQN